MAQAEIDVLHFNDIKRERRGLFVLLLTAILLFAGGSLVRDNLDARRHETGITLSSENIGGSETIEAGFLALGGFRGLLADLLWLRALSRQEAGQYYELTMLCDLILKLQPTYTEVHAYLGYNMCFNIANDAFSTEEEWFWIESGIKTLEQGLDRNEKHYALWWELGYVYFERLSKGRWKERFPDILPRIPSFEVTMKENRLPLVFVGQKRRTEKNQKTADPLDIYRYAKFYFQKAMQYKNDPAPQRTKLMFIQCLTALGEWKEAEQEWYKLWQESKGRQAKMAKENLWFLVAFQMKRSVNLSVKAVKIGELKTAEKNKNEAASSFERMKQYFPEENWTFQNALKRLVEYEKLRKEGTFTILDYYEE